PKPSIMKINTQSRQLGKTRFRRECSRVVQVPPCHRQPKSPKNVRMVASLVFFFAALIGTSQARGQAITADINVKLQPVLEHIDLVTDISLVGNTLFVCTQPGQLYRKSLSANSAPEVFLDVRAEVGRLGSHIPSLPGLGYPIPETYDERGLLGFAADPEFDRNGRFWIWYSNISERSGSPPNFFQWLVSTSD